MPYLIGLCGEGGVGKTTTARALRHLLREAEISSPGDILRDMLRPLYVAAGVPPDAIAARLTGALKRTPDPILGGRSPTHAMQTLGTEWARDQMYPALLLDVWGIAAGRHLAEGKTVINDSIRFPDEVAEIRRRGGVVVKILGESRNPAPPHRSEPTDLDFDFAAMNGTTPAECGAWIAYRIRQDFPMIGAGAPAKVG